MFRQANLLLYIVIISNLIILSTSYFIGIRWNSQPKNEFFVQFAADKTFAKYPVYHSSNEMNSQFDITINSRIPDGPDPFDLVSEDIDPMSDYIKGILDNEDPILSSAAKYFFDKVIT